MIEQQTNHRQTSASGAEHSNIKADEAGVVRQSQRNVDTTAFFHPDVTLAKGDDVASHIIRLAGNTGNVLFWDSLAGFFNYSIRIKDAYDIPSEVKTLVLSMGNWISPDNDLGDHAHAIEQSNVEKIVVLGAGAQAQTRGEPISLSSGTRRFLDLIAERSTSIGVRGDYTAEVLDGFGVKNVDVVGCPSVFMIDGQFRSVPSGASPRLAVHTTWHGHYRDAINELLRFGCENDAIFVEQSEVSLLQFANSRKMDAGLQYRLRHYSEDHIQSWKLLRWLSERAEFYLDLQTWRAAMSRVDLAIGSRFHGNVVAAIEGARTLLLTLDTRTEELAQYYNMPHMRFTDFDARITPESYYELADPTLFLKSLPLKKQRFIAFLRKNGLQPTESFLRDQASITEAHLHGEEHDSQAAIRRFDRDADALGLTPEQHSMERMRRALPLRTRDEGEAVDRAEFVTPRSERLGEVPPQVRVSWRARQGVANAYSHQNTPMAYDDRGMQEQWQREVYINAMRLAEANNFRRIVDFGCGSGFKLMKYFANFETVGVEIEPALSQLRTVYPDREWVSGEYVTPDTFSGDLVICSDVIEHLFEPDRLLSAMSASSAKVFVLSTPALEILADRGQSSRMGPPTNTSHVFEWTTTEFAGLVSQHLDIVAHTIINLRQASQFCVAKLKNQETPIQVPNFAYD
ncbi:polysaccharide pyruvyl transferase family protein [Ensifer sp. 22521]|uniref:polysaccharide pyruvyl transferase family protein n=1 Tax=Ensifer sp. 22521 TaxID=3453935 RepID=UPI003F842314